MTGTLAQFAQSERARSSNGSGQQSVVAQARRSSQPASSTNAQPIPDHGKISDSLLDLRQFRPGSDRQPGVTVVVVMGAGDQQVGHLGERETESLRCLDHSQQGDRLGRVEPVPTEGPVGPVEEAAPLVVAQRLDVDASSRCHLADPQTLSHDQLPAPGRSG